MAHWHLWAWWFSRTKMRELCSLELGTVTDIAPATPHYLSMLCGTMSVHVVCPSCSHLCSTTTDTLGNEKLLRITLWFIVVRGVWAYSVPGTWTCVLSSAGIQGIAVLFCCFLIITADPLLQEPVPEALPFDWINITSSNINVFM